MALSVCRGCRAAIRWITMASGAHMPVDPERRSEWLDTDAAKRDGEAWLSLVTDDGRGHEGVMVVGRVGSSLTEGTRHVEGYIPHWATCPDRVKFKRGSGGP